MARSSGTMNKGETRNPNGRPKKGESLTELMQQFLEKVDPKQKKSYKQIFVEQSYMRAAKGDPTFAKLVWNYIDGMPIQKIITQEGNVNQDLDGLDQQKEELAKKAKEKLSTGEEK